MFAVIFICGNGIIFTDRMKNRKNFVPHGSFTEVSFKRVSTIYDHKQTTFQVVVVYRWHLPSKYVIKHQKHGGDRN